MKKILTCLAIWALFDSCEDDISLSTIDAYSPKLVVNEFFNNHQPFSIQVSGSKDAYKEPNPVILGSAQVQVTLSEDGVNIPLSFDNFTGLFSSTAIPKSGKEYYITVTGSGFNGVYATGRLPGNITGKQSSYIEKGGVDMQNNKSDLLKITFKDDGATKDYYKLNFYYYSELIDKFNSFDFETKDILSAVTTIKTSDGGFLFTDESFNGKEKTFTAVPPADIVINNVKWKYLIQIQRLSEDFWKYNTTLEQYRGGLNRGGSGSNIFGGAVVVYTNINNGLGIFAGQNLESDTLK